MADDYPQFQALTSRRSLVSLGLVALLAVQEGFFFVVRRLRPGWVVGLRALSLVAWGLLALWLGAVFLRTWVVLTLA
jgi:hypothetical protein